METSDSRLAEAERVAASTETPPQCAYRPFRHTPLSKRISGHAVQMLQVFPMLFTEPAFLRPLSTALVLCFQNRLLKQIHKPSDGTRSAK